MADAEKFTFDRAKQGLKATRPFQRGTLEKGKDDTLTAEEIALLDDGSIEQLVTVSGVLEVTSGGAAPAADGDTGKGGKGGKTDA